MYSTSFCYLTVKACSQVLESLLVAQLFKKYPTHLRPLTFTYALLHATNLLPHPEGFRSNTHTHTHKHTHTQTHTHSHPPPWTYTLILSSHLYPSFFLSGFLTKILYAFVSSPMHVTCSWEMQIFSICFSLWFNTVDL